MKKFLLIVGTLVLMLSVTSFASASGNTSNSTYYFTFPLLGGGNELTSSRAKENNSSIYQKNDWIGNNHHVSMWAVSSENANDLSGGHYVDVAPGEHKDIPNVVYEDGYRYCKINAMLVGMSVATIAAEGEWSPDSR